MSIQYDPQIRSVLTLVQTTVRDPNPQSNKFEAVTTSEKPTPSVNVTTLYAIMINI